MPAGWYAYEMIFILNFLFFRNIAAQIETTKIEELYFWYLERYFGLNFGR